MGTSFKLQGRIKKGFKGTQHKYGKLGTIDTGACSLALPSTRQTSIFDPNVHHRLQSSQNWSSDKTGNAIVRPLLIFAFVLQFGVVLTI